MKTLSTLLLASILLLNKANAQFTQDFESTESTLTGNCWVLDHVTISNTPGDVINGTGSVYTNPPSGSNPTEFTTPALNVVSNLFTVAFNYKLSSTISGSATRTIEFGLLDAANNYSKLNVITLDKFSPATTQHFNGNYVLPSTGVKKLVVKLGGTGGDGNSRLIFDDLYTNASAKYGTGTCNSAPVAVNDVFTALIGSVVTGNVLNNDSEPDAETLTALTVALSNNGVLSMLPNGNFIFTPAPGFNGPSTTFTYRTNDNGFTPLYSNVATVTINYVAAASLPVQMSSFNATLVKQTVKLNWVTATELNVSHFSIEKSIDGFNFSEAGVVFAAGNTTETSKYSFDDNIASTTAKMIYYRIRTIDVDGKNQYTATKLIRIADKDATIDIQAYPNPVANELRITIPANWQNKKVVYDIYFANGAVAKHLENVNGSQTETINMSSLAKGLYLVRATCEGQTAQQKILKN